MKKTAKQLRIQRMALDWWNHDIVPENAEDAKAIMKYISDYPDEFKGTEPQSEE